MIHIHNCIMLISVLEVFALELHCVALLSQSSQNWMLVGASAPLVGLPQSATKEVSFTSWV